MKCRDAKEKIVLLLAGDLEPGERQKLDDHCRTCLACTQKRAEVEKDLQWLARLPEQRPEFNWEASWGAIRSRLESETMIPERRPRLMRILVPAASLGILLLAFIIGRNLLFPPAPEEAARSGEPGVASRLILEHMEDVGTAILEYMNREYSEADRRALDFEKQQAGFLLFKNRTLQDSLKDAASPLVVPLLNDLEIVLYEAANLESEIPEGHEFIKTLIRKKEILFRIRYLEYFLTTQAAEVIS